MKTRSCARCWFSVLTLLSASFGTATAHAKMKIGQNLDEVTYFSSAAVFANTMKNSRVWLTRTVGGTEFDSGHGPEDSNSIPLRDDGYPQYVPFSAGGAQHIVHTQVPVYEDGAHRITALGSGVLKIKGPGVSIQTFNMNGSLDVTLTASGAKSLSGWDTSGISQRNQVSLWAVEIHSSNSSNPIRDIRVMRPGYHTADRDAFDTKFISLVSWSDTLRFMNWQRINKSQKTAFNVNTKRTDYYTQATKDGVSLEHIVTLANQIDKNIWINVPEAFTDQAINDMAYYVSNNLEAGRLCYVEYTNEAWNPQFTADNWINANIAGANLFQRYGARAKNVFDIFKQHFDQRGKGAYLRRTLAGQNANTYILQQALITAGASTDCIATAPYFGTVFRTVPNPLPTLEQLDDETYSRMNEVLGKLGQHQTLAQTHGKTLVTYEGGQHYVADDGAENDLPLVDRIMDFNRDYRMRNLYRTPYLNGVNSRVSMFMQYCMVTRWTKFGCWGSMEWNDQTIGTGNTNAQKEWAIRDWYANN